MNLAAQSQYFSVLECSLSADLAHMSHYFSDRCSCGETQTMSHIVESWPQTRLHGDLSKLHSADDDAVAWLTSYGS